jgi:hypothetical protein
MTHRTKRLLALAGIVFQFALPMGLILTAAEIFESFGSMSGDTAQAATTITIGLSGALKFTKIGVLIGLLGFGLFSWALFTEDFRAPWILTWGRPLMVPWLIVFPVGTIISVSMLIYFSKHQLEFRAPSLENK